LIRSAKLADLSHLARLYAELRPEDPPLTGPAIEQLLSQLCENPSLRIFVAEIDDVLVSTCMVALVPNLAQGGKPFGVIEHVVTLNSCRRQGHSRRVLSVALDWAWQMNCYKVMLLSGQRLNAAHAVYQSLGFDGDRERGFVVKR
jgi:GNAT superfamily N-acetyltransferase